MYDATHSLTLKIAVTETLYRCLIVVEPRRFLGELICQSLQDKEYYSESRAVEGAEEAIDTALRLSLRQPQNRLTADRSLMFFLGGRSYFGMIEGYRRISSCFPRATFVLLDDTPRMGSGLTANLINIQGYLSLSDSRESWNRCLPELLRGHPSMTPHGKEYLTANRAEARLVSLENLRKQDLYALTEKEWLCFRHLISGGELTHLAQTLRLQERSAKNLKYRVMKKLNAPQFVDLLRMAHEWGFLDKAVGCGHESW